MNECRRVEGFDPKANTLPLNRWIVGATARGVAAVTKGIEDYKFNEAANAAYDFVWGTFCDWYVEFAKPVLMGENEAAKAETRATAAWALDQILKMLHPFMPFVTEELWAETGKVGPARDNLLILTEWPDLSGLEDAGRRCRNELADRRHLQCPLGAQRNERARRRQAAARRGRGQGRRHSGASSPAPR